MGFDTSKFSFKETFLNTNGKTSSTKLIGMAVSFVCILMIVVMMVFYMFNLAESAVIIIFVDKLIALFGIAAGLMGVKSISSSFGTNNKVVIDNSDSSSKKKKNNRQEFMNSSDDEEDEC